MLRDLGLEFIDLLGKGDELIRKNAQGSSNHIWQRRRRI